MRDGCSRHSLWLSLQVIVFLETGTGKTLIAALLIKHFADADREGNSNIVLVVPTALLVSQQAAVLQASIAGVVGQYTGDMGVDNWGREKWAREFGCVYSASRRMAPAIMTSSA